MRDTFPRVLDRRRHYVQIKPRCTQPDPMRDTLREFFGWTLEDLKAGLVLLFGLLVIIFGFLILGRG